MQKTKETVIYISVYTSSLTQLANKVARIIKPGEDIHNACSELAYDIAKDNKLDWSNVLYQYYNHYLDETSACPPKVPKKSTNRQLALQWWNNLSNDFNENSKFAIMHKFLNKNKMIGFSSKQGRTLDSLTGSEIEQIWLKECNKIENEVFDSNNKKLPYCEKITCNNPECKNGCKELKFKENPNKKQFPSFEFCKKQKEKSINQKQFTQFSEELFLKYINKFSDEDKLKMFKTFKTQISDMLYKFANIVDDSYRPVTRDNMNAYMAIPEFKKQEGIE